jgi:hypothetical protein
MSDEQFERLIRAIWWASFNISIAGLTMTAGIIALAFAVKGHP